jgi:hypothetical protein
MLWGILSCGAKSAGFRASDCKRRKIIIITDGSNFSLFPKLVVSFHSIVSRFPLQETKLLCELDWVLLRSGGFFQCRLEDRCRHHVERYHPVLKRAYAVIVADMPEIDKNNYGKEFALQMAVKAVNDTAGPDGLVPTLLVFGAQLDPPGAPTIAQRATAVKKATEEVTKIRAT